MKICVLRRDGQNVNNGMAMVIAGISEEFFGEKDISLYKDEEDFTQVIAFEIKNNEEQNVIPFILKVSDVNPAYAVRIKA